MKFLKWPLAIVLGLLSTAIFAALFMVTTRWIYPVGVNNYINKATLQMAVDSPEALTYVGFLDGTPLDRHSGKLADYTKAQEDKSLAKLRKASAGLDKFNPEDLSDEDKLTWRITRWQFDDWMSGSEIDFSSYPINQLSGPHVNLPSFLTDTHRINSEKSAERYLSRMREFSRVLGETYVNVDRAREGGVVAPDFVIEQTLKGLRSFIADGASKNPLVTTLPEKLEKIEGLSEARQTEIVAEATKIVAEQIIPEYEKMIAQQEDLLTIATHDAGIWRIPHGEKIYANALRSNTTTDMTADEIHNIGLAEVERIETAMGLIMDNEGVDPDLPHAERVRVLMEAPEHLFDNTDEGRAEMIAYLNELNTGVMAKAGEYFVTLPTAELEILRVPEFSQDGAPGGYYSGPSLDGKRPGKFYINLKNTHDNPRWTLPTLLYHEAAPGHHFQISRAQMITGVPMIRKLGGFTAYSEGWALYAEKIAAEDMGMYADDPLGDLGRLQAEMFRAVRLVVDTGLHHKRWSREKSIDYMVSKTGMTEDEVTREIERYVVWPGQATAYKTGQLAMVRMREKAERALGNSFDLRLFNEKLLSGGAMPLNILAEEMESWTAEQMTAVEG